MRPLPLLRSTEMQVELVPIYVYIYIYIYTSEVSESSMQNKRALA